MVALAGPHPEIIEKMFTRLRANLMHIIMNFTLTASKFHSPAFTEENASKPWVCSLNGHWPAISCTFIPKTSSESTAARELAEIMWYHRNTPGLQDTAPRRHLGQGGSNLQFVSSIWIKPFGQSPQLTSSTHSYTTEEKRLAYGHLSRIVETVYTPALSFTTSSPHHFCKHSDVNDAKNKITAIAKDM